MDIEVLDQVADMPDSDLIDRADRLKEALKLAGGGTVVARMIGMPLPTLNNYLAGRDMKVSAMIALADACKVSIEWLATGRGDMHGTTPAASTEIPWFGEYLAKPVHYSSLMLLTRVCREYHESVGLKPTLAQALEWISGPYKQHSVMPDTRLEIVPPKETGI